MAKRNAPAKPAVQATPTPKVPRIEASYESLKEWRADPKGYFLVKIFYGKREIGIRFMGYDHRPILDIYGGDAHAIVQTAVREDLLSSLQHAAYLGHELHKAEVALKLKLAYVQDRPLDFTKRATKSESDNKG